jgi:hypothetical protein
VDGNDENGSICRTNEASEEGEEDDGGGGGDDSVADNFTVV